MILALGKQKMLGRATFARGDLGGSRDLARCHRLRRRRPMRGRRRREFAFVLRAGFEHRSAIVDSVH